MIHWYDYFSTLDDYDMSFRLAKAARMRKLRDAWVVDLVSACRRSKSLRKHGVALARRMAHNAEDRKAFDAAWRLGGVRGATKLLKAWVAKPRVPMSTEERLDKARVARAKKAAKREERARRTLELHVRKLATEKRLVAKWKKVVARYDRRAATG